MDDLKGKVALISAASSGIGKSVASVLSSRGCLVHVFSSNEDRIAKAAQEIQKRTGNTVNYSVGSLANPMDVRRVMREVKERTGEINFLVINYGDPKVAPFMEINDDEWDSSINMILKSSIIMTRSVIPFMEKNGGRVVYITSMTTKQPMENFAISASLRSAVVSLSKVLSIEMAEKGITFNSISQGYFQTPRLESIADKNSLKFGITKEQAFNKIREGIPAKRFGNPEEIGYLVAFLCSQEASYINGTNIQIDGGAIKFPF
ncbi:MAG: SDR family oxidoreductase [Thermoplasmataceae archaeon]